MKGEFMQVEGHSNLVRDPSTNAVLNINTNEIESARERKRQRFERLEREKQLEQDVAQLKEDMKDLKSLLSKIAEKL